jgi:tetratricopeptide (TPR) repeat protein
MNTTTTEEKAELYNNAAEHFEAAAEITKNLEYFKKIREVMSSLIPSQSTGLYKEAAQAYQNAANHNKAAECFKQAGDKINAEAAYNAAELAYSRTTEGRSALNDAKEDLKTAQADSDNLDFTEIPTTQHMKVLDYLGSGLKTKGIMGILGHVFGFLVTLVLSPLWAPSVLIYNFASTSNNTLQNQTKTVIKPDDLDDWMQNIITSINNIGNLHQRTKDNILKELNSLKDQIDSQKSGWLVKSAIGDNSHYVEKSTVIKSITKINNMIEALSVSPEALETKEAASAAEETEAASAAAEEVGESRPPVETLPAEAAVPAVPAPGGDGAAASSSGAAEVKFNKKPSVGTWIANAPPTPTSAAVAESDAGSAAPAAEVDVEDVEDAADAAAVAAAVAEAEGAG